MPAVLASAADYHATLRTTRSSTKQDIHAAFRSLAIQLHPDKARTETPSSGQGNSGVEERFRQLAEAYDVLSNNERRAVYERFGTEGLHNGIIEQNGMNAVLLFSSYCSASFSDYIKITGIVGFPGYVYHNDPHLTFSEFFGGNNVFDEIYKKHLYDPKTGKQGMGYNNLKTSPVQDEPLETNVMLTLEELYSGCSKKVSITRKIMATDQTTTEINSITFNLPIAPGTKAHTKLVYPKQGDQGPNKTPADIVFIIQECPHKHFIRDGVNLIFTHTLSLEQALTGSIIHVQTLDHRKLALPVYEVIRVHLTMKKYSPNYTKVVPNEGMPLVKNQTQRGDLIIKFKLQFPTYLNQRQKEFIHKALSNDQTTGA